VLGIVKLEKNRVELAHWSRRFVSSRSTFVVPSSSLCRSLGRLDRTVGLLSRFYFLSSEQLVDLISTGLDPRAYLPVLGRLFRGIDRLHFRMPDTDAHSADNAASLDVYGQSDSLLVDRVRCVARLVQLTDCRRPA
jgi:hypothetical protein